MDMEYEATKAVRVVCERNKWLSSELDKQMREAMKLRNELEEVKRANVGLIPEAVAHAIAESLFKRLNDMHEMKGFVFPPNWIRYEGEITQKPEESKLVLLRKNGKINTAYLTEKLWHSSAAVDLTFNPFLGSLELGDEWCYIPKDEWNQLEVSK